MLFSIANKNFDPKLYQMGAYLALGIMKKVEIYRDNDGPSLEMIVKQMGKQSGFNPDIYDFSKKASYWTWTLNQEVIAKRVNTFVRSIL